MIDLHYWPTPNGWKISIMLEECGLPYVVRRVRIGRGEQFLPEFVKVSPNGKIPAIVDDDPPDGGNPQAIFESGAILIYLAEKTGRFLSRYLTQRMEALQWLIWQVGGLGPMAGQNGHFLLYAADKIPYAIERYGREVRRLYQVLDHRLRETGGFLAGEYSIADIATFPWVMTHKAQGLTLDDYPSVKRWFAAIRAREAVQRGLDVGKEHKGKALDDRAREALFGPGAEPSTLSEQRQP